MKLIKFLAAAIFTLAIGLPGSAAILYENGTPNGTFDAEQITPPQSISDSFILTADSHLTGATVALWVREGLTPASLTWMIGTSPFSSDIGSASTDLNNAFFLTNAFGFDVYLSSFDLNLFAGAGEYWLTLGQGLASDGTELFWDVNFGPSLAQLRNDTGDSPIASEYFRILGDEVTGPGPTPVPEPASVALLLAGIAGFAAARRNAGRSTRA